MKKVIKKKNNDANKALGIAIIFSVAFFILGTFVGFYFGGKLADASDGTKCDAPVEVEELPEKDN